MNDFSTNSTNIDSFSAEKHELLKLLLKEQGIDTPKTQIIPRRTEASPCQLSFAQQRLWFLNQLESSRCAYNILTAVRLRGQLNVAALEQSLNEIVQRHEALRTTFTAVDGQPIQVIAPRLTFALPMVDLRGLPEIEREAEVQRLVTEDAQQPFNLDRGSLLRVTLLRLSEAEHVVLFAMHHIVADGWSMGILIRELATLYTAFSSEKSSLASQLLPELPIQYADFALWQRQWLQGEVLDSQLSYWKRQLAESPVLQLPTDYPRPAVQTFRGAAISFSLSPHLTQALEALSHREEVTLFMTLLTAFKILLYRYTSQDDILVGSPIANRNRTETEGLIGFFVNTLVLRTYLGDNLSFRELLLRVREVTLEAYAHQDLPFEYLVEELQPERDLSYNPLFQVMFVLQNAPMEELKLPGLTLSFLNLENRTAKFDLTLSMSSTEQGLIGSFEYNTDLFNANTMTRMLAHWHTLLEGIVVEPEQCLSKLPLLTEAEQHQLLVEWHKTLEHTTDVRTQELGELQGSESCRLNSQENRCLHHLFEAMVERFPDAIAVTFEDQHLTYQELNAKANQLAHHLQSLGVEPEVMVGICVDRSVEMVVGLLGILKAGGAYVPLEPTYPTERLAFILQDTQVPVLLTQQQQLKVLPEHQATIVCLDEDWGDIARESQDNPVSRVTPNNLAYVIYTSGSTGQPKGVLVNHQNVTRLFTTTQSWFHFNQEDVWTLFHSYAFDFSVWEIWGALLHGGRVVVVPYWLTRSPEAFYDLLCQEQVTVLNQTPSAFRQLIKAEESLGTAKTLALRLVIFGGEALELQSLKSWFERHGDQSPQLVNMYGITETTVHVTYRSLTRADLELGSGSVIGRPIPDLQVYLLDRHCQPVPIGVRGEMYIGGAGLARGYLNRPELTNVAFIAHPFRNKQGRRLYKSGDLARYLPNGDIEYLGRIDHQVKIRGFRIELGEIEAVLAQYPAVRETVVLDREIKPGDKQLVAYVVPSNEQMPTTSELRNLLKKQLPEYMVPSTFVMLEALPLTPNGKVDRQALPAPESTRPELDEAFVSPRTLEEQVLAQIWAEVLSLEQVGIRDNFFALGGDSIRSIQVHSRARERGLSFSIEQLFQHQTIGELAQNLIVAEVGKAMAARSNYPSVALPVQPFSLICEEDRLKLPPNLEDAYPLTSLQIGMLFHSESHSDTATYHNVNSVHLQAPFELPHFQAALQHLIARHPVLRTSFDLSNFNEPLQLVHQEVNIPLHVEDIGHLLPVQQEELLTAWFEQEKRSRFDWTQAPLVRFYIHRRSEETFQFSVTEHHAILDGWSVASMLTELFEQYFSLLGRTVPLLNPPLNVAFRDFVALEQAAKASEAARNYWIEKLTDSTITKIPRWPSCDQIAEHRQLILQEVPLPPDVCQGLRQLAQLASVPLKSVLLAAHVRVMSLLSGESDILTGLVSNGRLEESDGERVLGLFLNTLPLRMKLLGGSWLDLVRETFAAEQELLPFRRYPLAKIQRDLGGQPLFETLFNFTHFHVYQNLQQSNIVKVLGGKGHAVTNFTFTADFNVDLSSSEIQLAIGADGTELCNEQIEAISGYYAGTLTAMAREPLGRYELERLLNEREWHQLLVEWNNTQTDDIQDQCIHQLFETQAKQTPNALAVVFQDKQLTYEELNTKANQLAHYLKRVGVEATDLVGICVERSLEMVIGLLGILKAGAAYVPLDSAYPKERLTWMVLDSQVSFVLTHQKWVAKLGEHQAQLVCLDTDWGAISTESEENPSSGVMPEDLAYAIYTSGSTGEPKGVMVQHQALVNFTKTAMVEYGLTECDRVLQFASISFDAAIEEIYPCLACGGMLVLRTNEMLSSVSAFLQQCRDWELTVLDLPTAYWHEVTAEIALANLTLPESLRLVIIGGEQALPEKVEMWQKCVGNCPKLVNTYGPTEATVVATTYKLSGLVPVDTALRDVPIGRPIRNVQVYVLDQYLQPVPIGVPGELHIGGVGLARGYLHCPELTAQKFIPNPFDHSKFNRLYKTGDLVRYLPDGNLEFLGRMDNQVKIRGFRIELGEIEAVLARHPQVRQAVTIAQEESPGNQRLSAYVVPEQGTTLSVNHLRRFLLELLPSYMVPAAFVLLEALPLTPNGKIDRRTLQATEIARPTLQKDFVAPRDVVEFQLVQIWESLLDIHPIGVIDNFFELGGHSLLAVRLMALIQKQFGQNLPLSTLVQGTTIEHLASILRQQAMPQPLSPLVAMETRGSHRPLFFVHPVGGNVLCYYELARHLGTDHPFYGLRSPGLYGESSPFTRIEDMAAHYIEALRTIQPEGPYLLGGWSLGGVVAFEMAAQLQKQGDRVARLILLDSQAPVLSNKFTDIDEASVLADLFRDMAHSAGKKLPVFHNNIKQLAPNEQLNYFLEQAKMTNLMPPDLGLPQLRGLLQVFKSNIQATLRYVPQVYPNRIILLRASDRVSSELNDPTLGWDKLSNEPLEILNIPGNHYTMLSSPHVQILTERLRSYLAPRAPVQ